jgi:hypothetical protein
VSEIIRYGENENGDMEPKEGGFFVLYVDHQDKLREVKQDWPDDYDVRNVLLECLALLEVKNVAAADECRTLDVAETLKAKIVERNVLVDGLNAALLCHIKTELNL